MKLRLILILMLLFSLMVPMAAPVSADAQTDSLRQEVDALRAQLAELRALLRLLLDQQVEIPKSEITTVSGKWDITYFAGATDQMRGWKFENAVNDWSDFPNVNFPKYGFESKDGLEYGMAESAFCQQDQECDVNTAAMHYRIISGDYGIPGIDSCSVDVNGAGCGIMLINVGNVTAMFRDSMVDYGFTVTGRYWNGDTLPTAIRAGLSKTAYNMLNKAGNVNQGANCSVPTGCQNVRLTFAIISGNELLVKGITQLSR